MNSIDGIERRLEDDGVADADAILGWIEATADVETAVTGADIVIDTVGCTSFRSFATT
jgi:hypothetical protein